MPPQHHEAIRKPGAACARCGAPLEEHNKHPSRLVAKPHEEPEETGAERQDFCPKCQAEARAGEYHSVWLAKRPAPPPPPKSETRKAQSQRLRDEFYRLSDLPEPTDNDLDSIYLLAHMLMKIGGFRWRETDDDAGVIVFEDTTTKQRTAVQSVPLDGDRLAAAQERLGDILA